MARTRGTENLQQEKNGTWTLRVGSSIEARLKRLQRLSRQGLVTDAEFAELRRKLLAML